MFSAKRLDSAGAARAPTILLVEDDWFIRLSLAEHLRDCGFRVLEAASGDSAKDMFAGESSIDIVFTDVQMPGRLDGLGLARWLHETYPDVDVMITSGLEEMTNRAYELCDPASVFAKPYIHSAIVERIRSLLH